MVLCAPDTHGSAHSPEKSRCVGVSACVACACVCVYQLMGITRNAHTLPAREATMVLCAPDTQGPWSAHSIKQISMKRDAYLVMEKNTRNKKKEHEKT